MRYEFSYFYEPEDDGPVVELAVECDISIADEPHPANPARTAFNVSLESYRLYEKRSGLIVNEMYDHLREPIVKTFYRDELIKVIDKYSNEGMH